MADELERFLALVRRDLGCDEARVLGPGEEFPESGPRVLTAALPDGRRVAARFGEPPQDGEAKLRRLEMLVSTFDTVAEAGPPPRRSSRPPVAVSLHDELSALCERAGALNALVIDANSPVVWGAAVPEKAAAESPDDSAELGVAAPPADAGADETTALEASRRALLVARGWGDLDDLRRGKRLRRVERAAEGAVLAHSFAGIYVLLLVFDARFDELRAERAVVEALPRIERLVLALPPLDPTPVKGAGVVGFRRPRRR